jgi:4-hydroxybenzoate polyprenyltransferase
LTQESAKASRFESAFFRILLYGNLWIALCAFGHGLLTQYLLVGEGSPWTYPAFLFAGTLAQYGTHRLISLYKHKGHLLTRRFLHIRKLETYLFVTTLLSALGAAGLYLQLARATRLFLILPILLSLLYVLPVWKGRRLRDFPFIKIFLIALVWTMLTSTGAAVELGLGTHFSIWLQFPERLLFLFAITIPFDIRDLDLDREMPVKTLPAYLGIRQSIRLALVVLVLSLIPLAMQVGLGWYSRKVFIGLLPSYVLAFTLIWQSRTDRPDSFFSFFLDGTIFLQAFGVFLATHI